MCSDILSFAGQGGTSRPNTTVCSCAVNLVDQERALGLVLVPISEQAGAYRRIGSFQTPGSHNPDDTVLENKDWATFEEGWIEQLLTIM